MYDDRFLLIFGGASRSKPLGDLFALDFETVSVLRPVHKSCFGCHAEYFLDALTYHKPLTKLALHCFQMEWCKLKTKGISPSPRSGHSGILIGDKWYIAGGETRGLGELVTYFSSFTWKPALISVISPHKRLFVLLCMLFRLDRDINA